MKNVKRYSPKMTPNITALQGIEIFEPSSKLSVCQNKKFASRYRIASGLSGPLLLKTSAKSRRIAESAPGVPLGTRFSAQCYFRFTVIRVRSVSDSLCESFPNILRRYNALACRSFWASQV